MVMYLLLFQQSKTKKKTEKCRLTLTVLVDILVEILKLQNTVIQILINTIFQSGQH